jgi:hypothetical protein
MEKENENIGSGNDYLKISLNPKDRLFLEMIILDNDKDGAKLLLEKYEINFQKDSGQALIICRKLLNKKTKDEHGKLIIKYSDESGPTIAF